MKQFVLAAEKFGLKSNISIHEYPFIQKKISIIPYLFAKQKMALPIEETAEGFKVAIFDPLDIESIEELRLFLKKPIFPLFFPKNEIELAIEKCYAQKEDETKEFFSHLEKGGKTSFEEKEGYDLLEKSEENPVIQIVNAILLEAIQQDASDIHFEPFLEGISIRYRIDGVLQKRHSPPGEYQVQILTRVKVMAKLDIAEHRLPQDGRIKLWHGGREIDFRVSTLPSANGERIVLRILDRGNVLVGLDHIGMDQKTLKQFRKELLSPEGIILVTGPTGSGKTTTLYSALSEINSSEKNIMTIEDPVEYKLDGISQMNVSRKIGLDFAKGLRHILRQDPDVIMIGEIRDKETAEIAIQSSLTGHLVLSTLHTNDAPSALTRLSDMGIEPYLSASSILAVIAQRLVRTICPKCKVFYEPLEEELIELGLNKKKKDWKFARGEGCLSCFHTGYKGRQGIYELMPMGAKLKEKVLKSQDAGELRKTALSLGMSSLFLQGVELVISQITTSQEVLRVTRSGGEVE